VRLLDALLLTSRGLHSAIFGFIYLGQRFLVLRLRWRQGFHIQLHPSQKRREPGMTITDCAVTQTALPHRLLKASDITVRQLVRIRLAGYLEEVLSGGLVDIRGDGRSVIAGGVNEAFQFPTQYQPPRRLFDLDPGRCCRVPRSQQVFRPLPRRQSITGVLARVSVNHT
jgi:hypothetical protein